MKKLFLIALIFNVINISAQSNQKVYSIKLNLEKTQSPVLPYKVTAQFYIDNIATTADTIFYQWGGTIIGRENNTADNVFPNERYSVSVKTTTKHNSSTSTLLAFQGFKITDDGNIIYIPENEFYESERFEKYLREHLSIKITPDLTQNINGCNGKVSAQLYLDNKTFEIDQSKGYLWTDGTKEGTNGQTATGLCLNQRYGVKVFTPEGVRTFKGFIINNDGTINNISEYEFFVDKIVFTIDKTDTTIMKYKIVSNEYTASWKLPDGNIVSGNENEFKISNIGGEIVNLILVNDSGTTVLNESISLKSISLSTITTSINQENLSPSLNLYPNPVSDVLNIKYSGDIDSNLKVEILDLTGRLVMIQNFYNMKSGHQIIINVNSLNKGIYFCKVFSENKNIGLLKFAK